MDSIDIEHSDGEPDYDDFDELLERGGDTILENDGNNENEEESKPNVEEAKEVKKKRTIVRNPQPKLDADRLKTERGLIALKEAQKNMVLKGKGHEARDLDHIMFTIEHWANRLFPKLSLDDFIDRTAKLGAKKIVSNFVHKMRMGDTLDIRRDNGEIIEDEVIDDRSDDEFMDQFEDDDNLLFARKNEGGDEKEDNRITDEDYEKNRNAIFDSIMNDKSSDESGPSTSRSTKQSDRLQMDTNSPTEAPLNDILQQVLESSSDDDDDDEVIKNSKNMRKQLLEDSDDESPIEPQKPDLFQNVSDDSSEDEELVNTPKVRRKRVLDDDDDEDDAQSKGTTDHAEDVNELDITARDLDSDDEDPIQSTRPRKRTRIIEEDDDESENPVALNPVNIEKTSQVSEVTTSENSKEQVVKENEENQVPIYDGPNIEWADFGL